MRDPYSILGVGRDASDDEIKKAYRDLARKNHPDRFINDPKKAEEATNRMQEINAAYDAITAEREGRGSTSSGGYSYGGYNNTYGGYGGNTYGQSQNPGYAEIRRMINEGDLVNAESRLSATHQGDRGAEWHYLYACLLVKKGNYSDAGFYFDTACRMDPYNIEYNNARRSFMSRMGGQTPYSTGSAGCSVCDICSILMCMDCCCSGGGC